MGPEILSSTGAGAWRKAPMTFPDSSSVLDKFQAAILIRKPFLYVTVTVIFEKNSEDHFLCNCPEL